jgi:hypothetical protein
VPNRRAAFSALTSATIIVVVRIPGPKRADVPGGRNEFGAPPGDSLFGVKPLVGKRVEPRTQAEKRIQLFEVGSGGLDIWSLLGAGGRCGLVPFQVVHFRFFSC